MIPEYLKITNEDNIELMSRYPDDYFDLAIVDPPYRDSNQPTKDMRNNGSMKSIEGRPNKEYFKQLNRVSKEQIIWGANNFQLPQFKGFIIWKKKTITDRFTMSMCEIASISEGLGTVSKWIEIAPQGKKEDPRIHPTQKPVALYKWLLKNYAKPNQKILDTHLGSGSIAIAIDSVNKIEQMNLTLTACELDTDYYKDSLKRIKEQTKWESVFTEEVKIENNQRDIFDDLKDFENKV